MGNGTTYDEAEKLLDTYYELGGNVSHRDRLQLPLYACSDHSSSILPTTIRVSQNPHRGHRADEQTSSPR